MSAPDSLTIYGVLYHQSPQKPIIVLCHQAGSSKDEYAEIAPQLNALGFNCLAIDQRSGGNRLGGVNQTAAAAEKKGAKIPII
jgi:alpha-beta hydrolase superfamily lysophospholipase